MTTYNTMNPVPSADARDRYDNSQVFDEFAAGSQLSTPDRLGIPRKTLKGMENEFNGNIISFQNQFASALQALGYEAVHLTYVPGSPLVVNRQTQLIDYLGSSYRVKTPATFPVTLTGTWATDAPLLLDVGDGAIRSDLANPALGSALVARANQVVTTVAALKALKKTSPSKYVAFQGSNFVSFYIRDDADTTTAETAPTVYVATDGARYKLNHNGFILAEQGGIIGDGTTVNTSAVLNGVNAAVTAAGATLVWRPVRYVCEAIALIPNQVWAGTPGLTELMAKNGLNADFVSSNFSVNTHKVSISGIRFNGNRANNTSGRTFGLKGGQPRLRNIAVINAAGTAMQTAFDIADGEMPSGFEGIFDGIILDSNGQHGWLYDGPTDSCINNLTIIDAGLQTDNTYYGFRATRNYRGNNIHTWNRGGTTNTPSAMMQIEASAPGCTGVNCHFEGGHTPLKVFASSCSFTASDYYATRGPYCIENYGLANQFHGVLGATSASVNPDYNGILCAGGNSRIDLSDVGCRTGAIDFTGSQGGNNITIVGWRATGIPFFGTPAANDTVDLLIGGGGGGQLRQKRFVAMTTLSTSVISETGTLGNANATLNYILDGAMVDLQATVAIIANGMGATAIRVTLPWTAARTFTFSGYDDSTNANIRGIITGGTNILRITSGAGTYVGANNVNLRVNGRFERS